VKANSILKSTIILTFATFVIKALGLIKQSVLAAYCGATKETDAFFIATGILTQLCVVIFSAISISLLTIHTNTLVKEGREKSNELMNGVLRIFLPISLGISLIFFLGAPVAAKIFAPAYEGDELEILARYIRIMSCAFVMWCYYLIVNVILETDKRFLSGRGQAFFQNVFIILGTIFLYQKYGIQVLTYGFLLSGLAECVLVTWCARKELKFIFRKISIASETKELMKLSIPLIIGNAIYEINDIVDKQISTGLGSGNVSYLTYGGTVNEIVTGGVVSAVSVVLFSHFATWVAEGNSDQVKDSILNVLECLSLVIFPIMVTCILAGDQMVAILYGRGNFNAEDVSYTYGVVVGYAVGFVFQAMRANLIRAFYAFQDTKRPMINGALAIGLNIILSIVLSRLIGVAGIAVATSSAMLVSTILLIKDVKHFLPDFSLRGIAGELGKGLLAASMDAMVLYGLRQILHGNLYLSFVTEGIIVVITYIFILLLLKSRWATDVTRRILNKVNPKNR